MNAFLLILALGITVSLFCNRGKRRFLIYGALLGVFAGIIATETIVTQRFSHLPDEPVVYGALANTPGATQRPRIVWDTVESTHPYGAMLGFVAGGTCGLLVSGRRKKPLDNAG